MPSQFPMLANNAVPSATALPAQNWPSLGGQRMVQHSSKVFSQLTLQGRDVAPISESQVQKSANIAGALSSFLADHKRILPPLSSSKIFASTEISRAELYLYKFNTRERL